MKVAFSLFFSYYHLFYLRHVLTISVAQAIVLTISIALVSIYQSLELDQLLPCMTLSRHFLNYLWNWLSIFWNSTPRPSSLRMSWENRCPAFDLLCFVIFCDVCITKLKGRTCLLVTVRDLVKLFVLFDLRLLCRLLSLILKDWDQKCFKLQVILGFGIFVRI